MAITEEANPLVYDRATFRFENNQVTYQYENLNEEKLDPAVHHSIEETPLDQVLQDSWTERLFYGIGNA